MPEHFGDLCKRGAAADHLRCQTVAKQMCRTPSRASDSGSRKRSANDVSRRGRTSQAPIGWIHTLKNTSGLILAAVLAKVPG